MKPSFLEKLGLEESDYFLTGSHAYDTEDFKVSTSESDVDYVVKIHYRQHILDLLQSMNINADMSCYNGGFRFVENGISYNIITCIDIEFKAWRDSLAVIRYFISADPAYRNAMSQKMYRYAIYEQLRGICKTILTIGK